MEGVEAPRATDRDSGGTGPADPAPRVEAKSFGEVLALVGRLLGRNLVTLVAPVTMLSVVLTVACGAAVLLNLDGQALIINGELHLDEPRRSLLVTSLVLTAVVMAAHLVMVAMVVVMAAGMLVDRRVSAGRAMRRAFRRSGPLLVLLTLTCAAVLAMIMLAAFTPLARTWAYKPLMAGVLAAAACWLLLTVPIVVLEKAGPLQASARLLQISQARRFSMVWSTFLIAIVPPVALSVAARWLVSQYTGMEYSAPAVAVLTVLNVLTVVAQGATLAVVTLNQSLTNWDEPTAAWRRSDPPHTMDLAAVAALLPARTEVRKARPGRAVVLAALAVLMMATPGVLYNQYLQANPIGLPAVQYWRTAPTASRHEFTLLRGDRVAVLGKSGRHNDIQVCADRECHDASTFPYPRTDDGARLRMTGLPDGSLAVAWISPADKPADRTWGGDGRRAMAVRLMRCTDRSCPEDIDKAPVIARGHATNGHPVHRAAVAITTSGQGVLAAVLLDTERDDGDAERTTLRIVRCADMTCANPRTLTTLRLQTSIDWDENDGELAITTGAGGRPIVAHETYRTGAVTVVSCDEAECRRPVTRRLVKPRYYRGSYQYLNTGGVEVVVPPDDRPVLLHRGIQDGQVRLLRCHTRDCAAVDAVPLAEPGYVPRGIADPEIWPNRALALGRDGLPLIATYDIDGRKLVLLACRDAGCARRDTVVLLNEIHPVHRLHMEVGQDGRPRVLRYGIQYSDYVGSALLICRDARCGA